MTIINSKIPFGVIDKLIHDYFDQEGFTCGLRDISTIVYSIIEKQAKRIEPGLRRAEDNEGD